VSERSDLNDKVLYDQTVLAQVPLFQAISRILEKKFGGMRELFDLVDVAFTKVWTLWVFKQRTAVDHFIYRASLKKPTLSDHSEFNC
jgi:hypothetical protein